MDIGEYEPFLAMGFSTPPVDQDIPPTFGTLLSCVSVCMRLLTKVRHSYNVTVQHVYFNSCVVSIYNHATSRLAKR